jgi:hypothetical protein
MGRIERAGGFFSKFSSAFGIVSPAAVVIPN